MSDAEILTRKLFENQPLMMVPDDTVSYRLKLDLQQTNAAMVIVSRVEDESEKNVQQEIFTRMLSRLPNPGITSQIIYTDQTTLQLNWLDALKNTQHVLICGVELKNKDVSFPVQKAVIRDQMQILPVENITFIDLDPALKKAMWTEWMKQFKR